MVHIHEVFRHCIGFIKYKTKIHVVNCYNAKWLYKMAWPCGSTVNMFMLQYKLFMELIFQPTISIIYRYQNYRCQYQMFWEDPAEKFEVERCLLHPSITALSAKLSTTKFSAGSFKKRCSGDDNFVK